MDEARVVIIFGDIETTGLNEHEGSILEIALVATDDNLVQIGEPFVSLVRPLHTRGYEVMDEYVRGMHTKSGLLEQIYEIGALFHGEDPNTCLQPGLPRLGDVERAAIEWAMHKGRYPSNPPPGINDLVCDPIKELRATPLGGNSVHFDKAWLRVHMDEFEKFFSHRIFDVSVMTEWTKRFVPGVHSRRPGLDEKGKPVPQHRAFDDITASITTAKYYVSHMQWHA